MSHLLFDESTRWLFLGTLGVLVLASLIAGLLKWQVAKGRPHGVIDNLNSRVKAWWVMVALIGLSFIFCKTGVRSEEHTSEIQSLSLHDALPICGEGAAPWGHR